MDATMVRRNSAAPVRGTAVRVRLPRRQLRAREHPPRRARARQVGSADLTEGAGAADAIPGLHPRSPRQKRICMAKRSNRGWRIFVGVPSVEPRLTIWLWT